jgi:hypothetical protein
MQSDLELPISSPDLERQSSILSNSSEIIEWFSCLGPEPSDLEARVLDENHEVEGGRTISQSHDAVKLAPLVPLDVTSTTSVMNINNGHGTNVRFFDMSLCADASGQNKRKRKKPSAKDNSLAHREISEQRRNQNRQSAARSRARQREEKESALVQIADLTVENEQLKRMIEALTHDNQDLEHQVRVLMAQRQDDKAQCALSMGNTFRK